MDKRKSMHEISISLDETHHLLDGMPLYASRHKKVTSFHEPGIAAVLDDDGARFIDLEGKSMFGKTFSQAFGFYEGLAAVQDNSGWYHVNLTGNSVYDARFSWAGNFQEGRCPVRDAIGKYFHICADGSKAYQQSYSYAGDYKYGIAVAIDDGGIAWHIDTRGNKIHDHGYPFLHTYHKGFAIAQDKAGYFHVDKHGHPAYQARFKYAEPFYNGQGLVREDDGTLAVIDEQGKIMHRLRRTTTNDDALLGSVMADVTGFWKTQALHAATRIGLFKLLHDHGPATIDNINASLRVDRDGLQRLVNALDVYRYVQISGGLVALDEKGKILHDRLPHAPILWGEDKYLAYSMADQAIRDGKTAYESCHGSGYFSAMQALQKDLVAHQAAFAEYARIDYRCIPDVVDFSAHPIIMDVGGGHGVLMDYITKACPGVKGIVFDRPEIIEITRRNMAGFFAPDRIQLLEGDFFKSIPRVSSCIVMSRVLHDWNDDLAGKILQNAWAALPSGGRLYIIELLKIPGMRKDIGITLDLHMYLMTGGKERTLEEYATLLRRSGFIVDHSVFSGRMVSIIVANKKSEGE
ncbi:MAG: hypothetical protein GYA24_03935 [Candidatus Lokiarchaeota archaeon]|nr:hypothetical protein [Candidatus Lokiarchaeota archaeon]